MSLAETSASRTALIGTRAIDDIAVRCEEFADESVRVLLYVRGDLILDRKCEDWKEASCRIGAALFRIDG